MYELTIKVTKEGLDFTVYTCISEDEVPVISDSMVCLDRNEAIHTAKEMFARFVTDIVPRR